MKSLFKVTLLATTMAVALNAPLSFAADTAAKPAATADSKAAFKNDDQKSAYALGASLGRYMENSLKEQEKLGIKLDKAQLIAGVQDAFADKSKLSDQEIEQGVTARQPLLLLRGLLRLRLVARQPAESTTERFT